MITRNHCPACDRSDVETILAVPFDGAVFRKYLKDSGSVLTEAWLDGGAYAILHCPGCQTLFQRAALDSGQSEKIYNQPSESARIAVLPSLTTLAHLAQEVMVLRQVLSADRPRVLDYGMGCGRWAVMAQAFGCDVDGVEINEPARQLARQHGIRVLTDDELPDATYDFINIDQVLEHLVDPLSTATRLAAKLKPGGLVLFGVPGSHSTLPALRRAAKAPEPMQMLTASELDLLSPFVHLTLFNSRSLKIMAARAGLELFRPSPAKVLAAGTLWNTPRQWNRNFNLPLKFWRATGTRLWFRRPIGNSSHPKKTPAT